MSDARPAGKRSWRRWLLNLCIQTLSQPTQLPLVELRALHDGTAMAVALCREAEDAADRIEKALLGGRGPDEQGRALIIWHAYDVYARAPRAESGPPQ